MRRTCIASAGPPPTASNGTKGFGWTEPGPPGGITKVDIYLSHNNQERFIAGVPYKPA